MKSERKTKKQKNTYFPKICVEITGGPRITSRTQTDTISKSFLLPTSPSMFPNTPNKFKIAAVPPLSSVADLTPPVRETSVIIFLQRREERGERREEREERVGGGKLRRCSKTIGASEISKIVGRTPAIFWEV